MWERLHALAILLIFTNILSFTDSSSNNDPHWVKFDPENGTLPADAIVGGYEDETLYIARAPHGGTLTPGKYIPSTHKAIISWGWSSHVANEFEILCGQNYKWVPTTTDNIPDGAVVGGYVQNTYEPLYVGRIHYKGHATIPGNVAVQHKVMYFEYDDKEIEVKYFEVLVKSSKPAPREYPHWVKYNPADGQLPADAIVGGYGTGTNETLYIARAPHLGSLTPGKYVPSTHQAIISWGWWSHVKTEFEILVGHNYKWVPTTVHYIPDGAVVGGYIQDSYEPLFVGRVHYADQLLPGKVAVSQGVLYFGYKDREIDVKNFEILVFDDEVEEPTTPTPTPSNNVPPSSSTTPPPSWTTPPPFSTTTPRFSTTPPPSWTTPPRFSTTPPPSWTTTPRFSTSPPPSWTTAPRYSTTPPPSWTSTPRFSTTTKPTAPIPRASTSSSLPSPTSTTPPPSRTTPPPFSTTPPPSWTTTQPFSTTTPPSWTTTPRFSTTPSPSSTTTPRFSTAPPPSWTTTPRFSTAPPSSWTTTPQFSTAPSSSWTTTLRFSTTSSDTEFTLKDDPHWVKYNPVDGPLPADAIVGGYGADTNETLYIARAPHMGSLTPGKYVPSTHQAIITWGFMSHVKTEFEILCGRNYKWVPTTTDNIPDGAVAGGYIQNSYEPLYVGRVHYLGQLLPGKVAVSHGVLYFGYEDREIDVKNFDILVKKSIIPDANPHWIQFNPATDELPADAIVGGYQKEPLYIARAPHEGSLTPGMYVPSTHKAYVTWSSDAHPKTVFEILCGRNYEWVPTTTHYIPNRAVVGGYIENSNETEYVGRMNYLGHFIPGKVAVSHGVLYFAYEGRTKSARNFEILVSTLGHIVNTELHWVKYNNDNNTLPEFAIHGGYDYEPLFIARAEHEGSLTPGKFRPSTHQAIISWGGVSHIKNNYEILCGVDYEWIKTTTKNIPDRAFVSGYIEDTHEPLFVGRTNYLGETIPGKVAQSHGGMYLAYGNREIKVRHFEILAAIGKRRPKITRSQSEIKTTIGQSVNLICRIVDGKPLPTISWQFRSRTASRFVSIPEDTNRLHISNVDMADAGTYKCVTSNEVGEDEGLFTLFVERVPRITGKDREIVLKGQSVNIECRVTEGIPESTISWEFKAKSGLKFIPIPGSDNVLRISKADETDAGTYKCIASNDSGYEMHWTELFVEKILDDYGVVHKIDLVRYIHNPKTILRCGSGDPSESISWFNNGVSTETKGESYALPNLDLSYEGHNYTCRVSGDYGTVVHTFVLVLTVSQLQFTEDRQDPMVLDLTNREDFELNCDFIAQEPANISWTFNGKLLDNQNSSRLTFAGNWGDYTCKVTSIHGTIQRSFSVTSSKCFIPRKPKYVNITPLSMTINAISDYMTVEPGQTLIFSCPGSENEKNHFQMFPRRNKIEAHCIKEDQFIVKDKSYKLSDLVCAREVQAAVVKIHKKCWTENNNSELLRFGDSESFEVCFDTANNIPLYIPGKISKWNGGGNDVTYKWHKYRGLDTHRDAYTCDNAISTCCYTKAQLLNARDVSVGPQQRSTFIDPLNAVPVWRPCNLLQSPWELMEISVRMLTALKDEFKIWSGTYMPQNKNGTIIPRYLWKAVEKTIAIIYINDPSPSAEDVLCNNICGTTPPWPNVYKKYIYCCDLQDFLVRFGLQDTNVGDPLPGLGGRLH